MIVNALRTGFMEGNGKHYQQPRIELRPRPKYSFDGRIYAVASSEDSVESAARLGGHMVMFSDRPWPMRLPAIPRLAEPFPILILFDDLSKKVGKVFPFAFHVEERSTAKAESPTSGALDDRDVWLLQTLLVADFHLPTSLGKLTRQWEIEGHSTFPHTRL